MGDLSLHFSRSEFACHCGCGRDRVSTNLIDALEQLRTALGNRPIQVLCGVRCWIHNGRVEGSSPHSRHLGSLADGTERVADAADICCDGLTVREVYRVVETIPRFSRGGVGVYPARGFVHCDVRPTKARWAVMYRGGPLAAIPEGWLT